MAENKYKYAGLCIYAVDPTTQQIKILLGREAHYDDWSGSNKFSDWGGGLQGNEDPFTAAIREGYEELMGILGDQNYLRNLVSQNGKGYYIESTKAAIYTLKIEYDPLLPQRFNGVIEYLNRCKRPHPQHAGFDYIPTCPEGYMEKVEMAWFTKDSLAEAIGDNNKDKLFRTKFLQTMAVLLNVLV